MAQKMPIRINKKVSATGGTYDYVKSDRVLPGEIWCIQGVAYENETGARGTFRRYIERLDGNFYLGEQQSPGAAELISRDFPLYLVEGEALVVRQASCTAGDTLALYAHGYKIFSNYIEEAGA
jgi:hypothetical protein